LDANHTSTRLSKAPVNPFKLLNTDAKNNYMKFMPKSINKIFVTQHSSFRIAFQNSNAISLINFLSVFDFHVDRFQAQADRSNPKSSSGLDRDFRTKLEIDLDHASPQVLLDFLTGHSDEAEFMDDSSSTLPKLIQLDGYKPIMSAVGVDGTVRPIMPDENHNDLESLDEAGGSKLKRKRKKLMFVKANLDEYLQDEFCQFYKVRPFMTSFNTHSRHTLKSNLVYFKETTESDISVKANLSCTSCLMIYLYRHIHRRGDFYFVKDHLPACFMRLHFNLDKVYQLNSVDQAERDSYVKSVEESFRFYWKLLECKKLSGLGSILNEGDLSYSDDSLENYELTKKQCSKDKLKISGHEIEQVNSIKSQWHSQYAENICIKNLADSKTSKYVTDWSSQIEVGLKKAKSPANRVVETKPNIAIAVFLLFLVSLSSMILIILHYRYKRSGGDRSTCLGRLKMGRAYGGGIPGFQRLKNNNVTKYDERSSGVNVSLSKNGSVVASGLATVVANEQPCDELDDDHVGGEASYDAYEYDDEFEMNRDDEENDDEHEVIDDVEIVSAGAVGGGRLRQNANYLALSDDNGDLRMAESNSAETTANPISSLTNKSLKQIKRIKTNIMNNPVFKKGLLSNINKRLSHNSSYSSYRSTEAGIGGEGGAMSNEFELRLGRCVSSSSRNNEDNVVIATYDLKKRSKQNIVRKKAVGDEEDEVAGGDVMHMATNPLDDLGLDDSDMGVGSESRRIGAVKLDLRKSIVNEATGKVNESDA
jgi:hypothetical protein